MNKLSNNLLSEEERKKFLAEIIPIVEKKSIEEIEKALQQILLKEAKHGFAKR